MGIFKTTSGISRLIALGGMSEKRSNHYFYGFHLFALKSTISLHLYVDGDAEDVTLVQEKPIVDRNLTVKLEKVNSNHWCLNGVVLSASDDFRYKYSVKFENSFAKKIFNYFTNSENAVFCEGKFRTLKWGTMQQFDIFKIPRDNHHPRRIFKGHLYFLKMIFNGLKGRFLDLKDALIEMEHIGFGAPSYANDDKATFFKWISDEVDADITPTQSAFLCSTIAQLTCRTGCISSFMNPKTATVLLSRLQLLSKEMLSSSSLSFIKQLAPYLLRASTSQCGPLQYIKYFCNLDEVSEVLRTAQSLPGTYKEDQFENVAYGAIDVICKLPNSDDRTKLIAFTVKKAATFKSLLRLYEYIDESHGPVDALEEVFVRSYHRCLSPSSHRMQDLLEEDLWGSIPLSLKKQLAVPYCEALIEQIGRDISWTEERLKSLQVILQEEVIFSSAKGTQLLRCVSTSKDGRVRQQLVSFLNTVKTKGFWNNLGNGEREKLCVLWLESAVKATHSVNSSSRRELGDSVIDGLNTLEQIGETYLLSKDKELCSKLGNCLMILLDGVDFDTVLGVYENMSASLSQFSEEWLLTLMKTAVHKGIQGSTRDGKSKMKRLIQTFGCATSKFGRERCRAR